MLAFLKTNIDNQYTAEFKISCIEQYLQGKMSMEELIVTHNISSDSVLQNWISCYNANREFKDYNPKKEVYMAEARRKTTIEERSVYLTGGISLIFTEHDEAFVKNVANKIIEIK